VTHHVTQIDRLVKAARSSKGVCRIDFQLPNVIDGGDPILNFPGRMYDADRLGYCFEVIGKRNRCKVFRLISEPEVVSERREGLPDGEGPTPQPSSVEVGHPTLAQSLGVELTEASGTGAVRTGSGQQDSPDSATGERPGVSVSPTLFDLPAPQGPRRHWEAA
jgi:hypothetical protein